MERELGVLGRRLSNFLDKWLGYVERRLEWLPWLLAVAFFVVGVAEHPTIKANDTQRLANFYVAVGALLTTVLVAAALFQATSKSAGYQIKRFFGKASFGLIGTGIAASIVALSDTLPGPDYRWVFAVALSAGIAVLGALVLAGIKNLTS